MNGIIKEQFELLQLIDQRGKYYDLQQHELTALSDAGLIWQDSEVDDEFGYQKFWRVTGLGRAVLAQADSKPMTITFQFAHGDRVRVVKPSFVWAEHKGKEFEVVGCYVDGLVKFYALKNPNGEGSVHYYDESALEPAQLPAARTLAAGEAGEVVSDEVALHRAEIARLRGVLKTIRDYPIVESEMEIGHQVAGMAMQAEVALEADPPKSGLLTILSARNEQLRSQLTAATARAEKAEGALEEIAVRAKSIMSLKRHLKDLDMQDAPKNSLSARTDELIALAAAKAESESEVS